MKGNYKGNNGWRGFLFAVLTTTVTGGIGLTIYYAKQDYHYKKEEEDRKKKREEADRYREEDKIRAEQEDPELKQKQQDKEVKAYVFQKLGLDNMDVPEGEHVYANGNAYYRLPLVGNIVAMGDLCVLVSQPGVGKSILAFQMGDDIAGGKVSKLFPAPSESPTPQLVFYWDAEMDSDDMKERYPQGLSGNLIRFSQCNYRNGFHLLKHIYDEVSPYGTDVTAIFDNWKALCPRIDAYYFMTGLRRLQAQFEEKGAHLTIIIVIHTTKEACKKYEVDLGDVAGAAEITRFAKTVLFVNPVIDSLGVVQLHDAKRRRAKKIEDILLVLKGGEGTAENLHFECISEDNLKQMVKDNAPDFEEKKKSGKKSKFTDEDDRDIARRLDRGEKAGDLAKEYKVTEKTIYERAKPYREKKK